jgi:hypothetical protein
LIPTEWLLERMEATDPEELARRELQYLEILPPDWDRYLASPATARWKQTCITFLEQLAPDDELWSYSSPPETWADFSGVAGYAIVRGRMPILALSTRRS